MKQRWFILICLLALLALGMPTSAKPANLLKNSDFESVENLQPKHWQLDYWLPGASVGVTQSKVYDGKYALVLQSDIENDCRMIQTVKVKGNQVYRFSGWVATEGVPEGQYGANLCVMGGFVRSEGVNATTDWRPLELVFRTYPGQKEVTLGVRLGFYGSTNTGKVYFDGLKLEPVDNWGLAYQQIDPPQPQPQPQPGSGKSASSGKNLADSWFYPALIILWYLLLLFGLWLKPKELYGLLYQPKLSQRLPELFLGAVVLSFIIRFPLYGEVPFATDMGNFKAWALRIADTGPLHFYAPDYYCDYPPFSLYIYWLIGGLIKLFRWGGNNFIINFLLKLPSFICDTATAWLIYVLLKKKNPVLGWVLSIIYLFLPAIIYNSSYWGQVDTYYLFLVLLIFYLLTKRQPEWAAVCLAASFLTKAQTLAFIPLLLFYLVINYDWKRWISTILAGVAAFILIILPFNLNQPWTWIYDLYFKQAELYPYATMNAANFIAVLNGNYVNDGQVFLLGLTYRSLGLLLFGLSVVWSCWYYWKKRTLAALTVAFTLTSFAFFMFFPRMHERYLFPVFAFLLLLIGYTKNKILFFITLLLNLSYLLNMHAVILKFKNLLDHNVFERSIYVLGLIHTVLFMVIWLIFQMQLGKGRTLKQFLIGCGKRYRDNLNDKLAKELFKIEKRDYLMMTALVLGYALLVLVRLGSWSTPQKGLEMLSPEQGVEVLFEKPSAIDSVAIYDAEGSGELVFEYYDGAFWNRQTYDAKEYYLLNRFPLHAANVVRMRISPNPAAGKINEIAFFDGEKNLIPVKIVFPLNSTTGVAPEEHPLFDEQELMTVKPSYLNSTYFDEIYHGRTAYEFVSGSSVYETTHPQFGKDLLSLGILIFGMNPFGMRFVHALMGILLIILLFFLGRQILGTRFGAYCTMGLGMIDFMPLVQSRYATIDTTSVFFIGLMYLFTFKFIKEQESGISLRKSLPTVILLMVSFALGAGVKWTVIYGFAGVVGCVGLLKLRQYLQYRRECASLTVANQKKGKNLSKHRTQQLQILGKAFWKGNLGLTVLIFVLAFFLIVPGLYYLGYLPYLNSQGITEVFSAKAVSEVIKNQRDMFNYHSKLEASHPFASSWWSWPFCFKPLWIYRAAYAEPGMKGSIVSMGNPLIWWVGVVAILIMGYQLITNRRFSIFYMVLIGFFSLYLPWVLVSRCTFIYHFYPTLPLLYIVIAFLLEAVREQGITGKRMVDSYFIAAFVLLILFYPVLTGLEVPQAYADRILNWFPKDWVF